MRITPDRGWPDLEPRVGCGSCEGPQGPRSHPVRDRVRWSYVSQDEAVLGPEHRSKARYPRPEREPHTPRHPPGPVRATRRSLGSHSGAPGRIAEQAISAPPDRRTDPRGGPPGALARGFLASEDRAAVREPSVPARRGERGEYVGSTGVAPRAQRFGRYRGKSTGSAIESSASDLSTVRNRPGRGNETSRAAVVGPQRS